MRKIVARLRQRGQGLVEYGLVLVLIAIAVILIVGFVGSKINTSYSKLGSIMPNPP